MQTREVQLHTLAHAERGGSRDEKTTLLNLSVVKTGEAWRHPRAHAERGSSGDEKTTFLYLSVLCRPGKRSGTPEHMLSEMVAEVCGAKTTFLNLSIV